MKKLISYALIACLAALKLHAQITTPEAFLGYPLGKRFTPHHKMVDYFKEVAEQNPNIKLIPYGETNEKRPLFVAVLASAENMARLEQIRTDNLKRSGLIPGNPTTQVPINWMSFNVHGNESVGMEAAIATFHTLADPSNTQVQSWLKDQVVVIDPCINPDGRDRYAMWYNQKMNTVLQTDPQSMEHSEPWPGGRANHYLFDLNRDWAWQVQVESQQRLKLYQQWMPQLHLDFHEQGIDNPFYMAPAAEPLHAQLSPYQHQFQDMFGRNTAKYFDQMGRFYFTKERFDLLYPAYGDTYPMYNGAIGMTIEQGGGGRAGIGMLNTVGDTVTLAHRIEGHYTAALSAVEMTSIHKEELLKQYSTYFQSNTSAPKGKYKSFVIKRESNPAQLEKLLALLDKNGIQYQRAKSKSGVKGYAYQSGQPQAVFSVSDQDLLISAYQPKSVLTQVLFEPNPQLNDSITYDITSWSMPYAYGLNAYATEDKLVGQGTFNIPKKDIQLPDQTPVAYIAAWQGTKHAAFLAQLLRANIRVKYAENPFSVGGKSYPQGSLLITKGGNQHHKDFDQKVIELARQNQVELETSLTGYVDSGNDFGSPEIRVIKAPKIALVGGSGTSSLNYGEIWHFFEQELKYPLAQLEVSSLNSADLSKYDVLILPSLFGSAVQDRSKQKLTEWVKAGGKLIAMDGALGLFVDQEGYGLKTYSTAEQKKTADKRADEIAAKERLAPHKQAERLAISNEATGAIYQVAMDTTHPLGYGTQGIYYTLKNNSNRYAYLDHGVNAGIIQSANAYRTGFIGYKIKEQMAESLVIGTERIGRGHLVYFADNPIFRGFWESGKLVLSNAIFLVGQ
ncbi:MAG: M14 family metallopeptidase [Flavobacteriaceae bacterium]